MEQIEDSISRRAGCPALNVSIESFRAAAEPAKRLIDMYNKVDVIKTARDSELETVKNKLGDSPNDIQLAKLRDLQRTLGEVREAMYDLEEQVIPIVLSLPCILRSDVPSLDAREEVVKSVHLSKINAKPSFKQLDFRQLAYINESMFASLVGPDSIYQLGKLAELHFSLQEHFGDILRSNLYVDFCGMDFVKDCIVEACNSKHEKDYANNPFRIDRGYQVSPESQHLHISGDSSVESFAAYLSKKRWNKSVDQKEKFVSVGTDYDLNNESRIVQRSVVRTCTILGEEPNEEVENLLNILWKVYPNLDIPIKVTKVSAPALRLSEHFRYDISTYIRSLSQWVQIGYVASNHNYLPRRLGIEDVYMVNSLAIDVRPVIMAIVEYNQQSNGTFILPKSLNLFDESS